MKLNEIMTRGVCSIEPAASIKEAARMMAELDIGALPVVDGGQVVGIITDRDISIRGVAAARSADTPVSDIMSKDVVSCGKSDEIEDVLEIMAYQQVRRVPVCADDGKLVGIFSVGDAAREDFDKEEVAETLQDICRPHGRHSQILAAL